jgi:hypothetical protein
MDVPEHDPLRKALDAWPAPAASDRLRTEVWRQIDLGPEVPRRPRWFRQPVMLVMGGVCAILAGFLVLEVRAVRVEKERNRQLSLRYLQFIDPLLEMAPADETAENLDWMKRELGLTDQQFELIKRLHEASWPAMRRYSSELKLLRERTQEIEARWRSEAAVDFVALAELNAQDREIDADCRHSVNQLVASASAVMDIKQRARYLRLVAPVLHPALAPKS